MLNRHEVHYNDIMSQIDMRYIIHVTIGSNRQCVLKYFYVKEPQGVFI